jgi:hypothetical protein
MFQASQIKFFEYTILDNQHFFVDVFLILENKIS